MTVTLIHGNCKAKAAGDFTAAAEIAYCVQSYFHKIGDDTQCILTSSKEGVKKFQSLYGNSDGLSPLNIHGVPFEVVDIHEFANSDRKKEVKNFLEVGFCEPPPVEDLAKIVNPLSTKVIVVGLPHYPMNDCEMYLTKRFPQSFANGLAHKVVTGFGDDRVGMPVYQGPVESLQHVDYCGVTLKPYGFAYFKGGMKQNETSTMLDYLKVSTSLDNPYENFVLIGNCNLNLQAIKDFAMNTSQKPIQVYDQSSKTIYNIIPQHGIDTDSFDIQSSPMPKNFQVNDNAPDGIIRICLLDHVPTEKMRPLLKGAQPFFCSEGIHTPIEGMAFGKIPFIHYMENNEGLYPMHRKAVLDACSPHCQVSIEHMLDYCLRKGYLMSSFDRNRLKLLLEDPVVVHEYIKTNLALINDKPEPGQTIVNELHKDGKPDPNYHGKAFGATIVDRAALLETFLLSLQNLLVQSENYSALSSKPSPYIQNSLFKPEKTPPNPIFKPTLLRDIDNELGMYSKEREAAAFAKHLNEVQVAKKRRV